MDHYVYGIRWQFLLASPYRVQHLMETRRLMFSERLLIDVLRTKLCTNFIKEILAVLREFCIPEQCASITCIRHLKLFIAEVQILLMRFSVKFVAYKDSWYGCNCIQIVVSCVCVKLVELWNEISGWRRCPEVTFEVFRVVTIKNVVLRYCIFVGVCCLQFGGTSF
jgi:hypothetical protein